MSGKSSGRCGRHTAVWLFIVKRTEEGPSAAVFLRGGTPRYGGRDVHKVYTGHLEEMEKAEAAP